MKTLRFVSKHLNSEHLIRKGKKNIRSNLDSYKVISKTSLQILRQEDSFHFDDLLHCVFLKSSHPALWPTLFAVQIWIIMCICRDRSHVTDWSVSCHLLTFFEYLILTYYLAVSWGNLLLLLTVSEVGAYEKLLFFLFHLYTVIFVFVF